METRTKRPVARPSARPSRRSSRLSPSLTALVAVLCLALSACSGSQANAGSDTDAPPTQRLTVVGISVPDLENDFFRQLCAGAREEAHAQRVELVVNDAEGSAATQVGQLQRLSAEDASAVVVAPVDGKGVASAVHALRQDDVPVVAVDRAVQGARTDAMVSSHNSAGGWKAADALADLLEGEGRVVHLRGPENASVSQDRGDGFRQALAEHPGVEVVDSVRADFDREAARQAMTRLIAEHPDVTGVFAENDEMALGAIDALGARAGSSVHVVGFDGTAEALEAVKEGRLSATVAQSPVDMGKLAVRNALRLAAGDSVDKKIEVPTRVVRADD
jgi:ABC-type sugar transport system substrate-binding protein